MPPAWRRLLCRWFGHRYVDGGVAGLLEICCCARCGALQRYRGGV